MQTPENPFVTNPSWGTPNGISTLNYRFCYIKGEQVQLRKSYNLTLMGILIEPSAVPLSKRYFP